MPIFRVAGEASAGCLAFQVSELGSGVCALTSEQAAPAPARARMRPMLHGGRAHVDHAS